MTSAPDFQPVTVTVLTPAGQGAIAVVAVEGPGATAAVEARFLSATGRRLASTPLGRILFGRWESAMGEEVVVCRRSEQSIEIHCHGGMVASAEIVRSLTDLGCTAITPERYLEAIEPNAIKREATLALADAVTERAAFILLDQYQGALEAAFQQIEARIAARDFTTARQEIETLLQRAPLGLHLTKPWQVVLAGRPNVGKSSLINALVGYERAIVFETPGTTRDIVTATTAFGGWAVELSDTAGQRETTDEIEAAGVAKAQAQCAKADLIVLVLDAAAPSADDASLQQLYPNALVIRNKIDLFEPSETQSETPPANHAEAPTTTFGVSARTGQGIDQLMDQVIHNLVPAEPPRGTAVPFTPAQVGHLQALLAQTLQPSAVATGR